MRDLYQTVTDQIVGAMEAGALPFGPRWVGAAASSMPRRATGERYRGVNVLLLWASAQQHGFGQNRWLTYKQAQEVGAQVRKGERGTNIVFFNRLTREEAGQDGETAEKSVAFLKGYTVFNVEQVDGLGDDWFSRPPAGHVAPDPIPAAEAFFDRLPAVVRHGGARAFYAPSVDAITMPPLASFLEANGYYATRAHETVHWTGADHRLARVFGKRFGDDAYAMEELVAELGAAFLCADLGLSPEPRGDHASYLDNWLKVLKGDKRAIFTAASAAQAACDFIHAQAEAAPVACAA